MDLSRHRNLFNGDSTFLFGGGYLGLMDDPTGPFTAQVMHRFVDLLADNGVDTYLCNPQAQVPWYPSRVSRTVLTGYRRGDKEFVRGHYPPANDTDLPKEKLEAILEAQVPFSNRYLDLVEAGVDWVAEIAKACRRRGVAPWLTFRMNDLHGANNWAESYMNAPPQRDPRTRLSGRQPNPREAVNRFEQGMNWGTPEVREYQFSLVRELVEDYDYEGLEMDWLRQPLCCEAPASQEAVDAMTEWVARVRELTAAKGRRLGRAFPLGVRVPVRYGVLKDSGIDVDEWVRRGLIDYVAPSNAWQAAWDVPYDEIRRELGAVTPRGHRVALFGVVEAGANWLDALDPATGTQSFRLLTASAEFIRGNAAGKLALGVDAVEQFNFFCADEVGILPTADVGRACYPALRGVHDLANLRGREKQYALASQTGYYQTNRFEYAEQVPAILEPQWRKAFRVPMCEEPGGMGLELVVQIVVEDRPNLPDVGVSFNSSWPNYEAVRTDELLFRAGAFTRHVAKHVAFNFRFDVGRIKEGWNEVLVFNAANERATPEQRRDGSLQIVSVELGVKRR